MAGSSAQKGNKVRERIFSDEEVDRLKELLGLDKLRRENNRAKAAHTETLKFLREKVKQGTAGVLSLETKARRVAGRKLPKTEGVRVGMCVCGCGSVYWMPGKPPVKIMKDGANIIYKEPACLERILRINGAKVPLRKVA